MKGQLTNKEYLQLIETISSIDAFQMIDIEWESNIDVETHKRIYVNFNSSNGGVSKKL
jgi:3-dehydroquinate dehydratase-1